jgi:hypothetical protein
MGWDGMGWDGMGWACACMCVKCVRSYNYVGHSRSCARPVVIVCVCVCACTCVCPAL